MSENERWTRIDRLTLRDSYLSPEDECYFLLERSNGTFVESFANDMVNNFQKDFERFGDRPEVMQYKQQAIRYFGQALARLLSSGIPSSPWLIIPMVTSLPKNDKYYDNRLYEAARYAAGLSNGGIIVDDILDVKEVLVKAKNGGSRDPIYLESKIIAEHPRYPNALNIVLIDDVFTSGGHFIACRNVVRQLYPSSNIIGAFLSKHTSKYDYGVIGDF